MDFSRGHTGITVHFSDSEMEKLRDEGILHRAGPHGSGIEVVYDKHTSLAVSVGKDRAIITTNSLVFPITIEPVDVESRQGAFIGNNESVTLAS